MQVTFFSLPGNGTQRVTLDGAVATLRQVLEQVGVVPNDGEKADLAVNGVITTDLDASVPDGATVSKTRRIVGG